MRPSPLNHVQRDRIRTVIRHRRATLAGIIIAAIIAIGAVVTSATVNRGEEPEFLSALARVTGPSGSASAFATTDSSVITDGRTFHRAGDTVAVLFANGEEAPGEIRDVLLGSDSSGVSGIVLLGGMIAPHHVAAGASNDMTGTGYVACLTEEGLPAYRRIQLANSSPDMIEEQLPECGGVGTVITDAFGSPIQIITRGTQGRRLPSAEIIVR